VADTAVMLDATGFKIIHIYLKYLHRSEIWRSNSRLGWKFSSSNMFK